MQAKFDFLTVDECAQVDAALLTAQDKFATRVAIYALRSLQPIAQAYNTAIPDLTPAQIEDWVYQDEILQTHVDRDFKPFFARLVFSSIKPLLQAAQNLDSAIEQLTVPQIIAHFEHEAKQRLMS